MNTQMTPFQREVRARIYSLLVEGEHEVDVAMVARNGGWAHDAVADAFSTLARQHRIAVTEDGRNVWMAHPFSGVTTSYRAVIGEKFWFANCAWDALAILALLGDGQAHGPDGLEWRVESGSVSPDGLIHLLVPARSFWEDIGFT